MLNTIHGDGTVCMQTHVVNVVVPVSQSTCIGLRKIQTKLKDKHVNTFPLFSQLVLSLRCSDVSRMKRLDSAQL